MSEVAAAGKATDHDIMLRLVMDQVNEMHASFGEMKADVSEVKTEVRCLREDVGEIKNSQAALAYQFTTLDKRVADKTEVDALKLDMAKRDEHSKADARWLAGIAAFIGGIITVFGEAIVKTFTGK